MTDRTTSTVRLAERGVAAAKSAVVALLTHVQLRLKAIELARDPETKRWVADMRARVARGELREMIAAQPENPRSLLVKPGPAPS